MKKELIKTGHTLKYPATTILYFSKNLSMKPNPEIVNELLDEIYEREKALRVMYYCSELNMTALAILTPSQYENKYFIEVSGVRSKDFNVSISKDHFTYQNQRYEFTEATWIPSKGWRVAAIRVKS